MLPECNEDQKECEIHICARLDEPFYRPRGGASVLWHVSLATSLHFIQSPLSHRTSDMESPRFSTIG